MNNAPLSQTIEVSIGGRRYKITLDASFSPEAINEIKDTFHLKEITPMDLFKAYLGKVRDISELNAQLKQLLNKIP
ncbi:hypothetical protein ACFOPX_03165 [Helicobacter baculiformis]|uniref:Uncharacterized protein n=1 Tax=Helicobacter baculiformis TaxID=427351 RepID=A0ABV7ZG91_9HELI|nr:hypothetical protein [Helicobacter baculiformis]